MRSGRWDAEDVLERWGLEPSDRCHDPAEGDDPEALRHELELQRVAAHLERRARTERAVICEIEVADDGSMLARIATPTGDRSQEEHLARAISREAMAVGFVGGQLMRGVVMIHEKNEAGELTDEEAWSMTLALLADLALPKAEEEGES